MIDEGPSPEDLERFGGDDGTGYCPSCGVEISDLAEVCPGCGEALRDGPARRPPVEGDFRRRTVIIVAVLTLLGFLLLYLVL